MVSNVSNYVAGFDESGKRIGSIIFDGDPASEKDVAAAVEKGKATFLHPAVLEVISADDFG